MDMQEIEDLVNGDPSELIKVAEKLGYDFSELDPNIAKEMASKFFNISEIDFKAVDFIFWFAYFVERMAEELIIEPEVHVGGRREAISLLVKELHFGSKIKMIQELHLSKGDPMIKMMRKVQDFRNDIAHGRFDDLMYKGFHLSDNRAKLLLVGELRDIMLKK